MFPWRFCGSAVLCSMVYFAASIRSQCCGRSPLMSVADELIATDQQYILQVYGRPNFVIARGEGCYLYDTEGRRYLDMVAGIAVNALGYGDPDVAEAIRSHADGLLHLSNL